jgi:zinc-binding alcohol dehydrogenase/oxidoreductase
VGRPPGTLAEYIAVSVDRLYPKPAHLSMVEAAALPLAGITAYRYATHTHARRTGVGPTHAAVAQGTGARHGRAVVTKANVREGDVVLVTGIGAPALRSSYSGNSWPHLPPTHRLTRGRGWGRGIGGGVAMFALQFAVARGAQVWVTSSDPAKIARAVDLGARGGLSYKEGAVQPIGLGLGATRTECTGRFAC